ncbi:hypothetical protein ACMFMG_006812 [Clarireedia jacksonii]
MPTLSSLAVELITMVAAEVDRADLLRLRLVCKDLQFKLDSCFLATFFETRHHMVSRASLENLYQVSRDPKYGLLVHSLVLFMGHITHPDYSESMHHMSGSDEDSENSGSDEYNNSEENNTNTEHNVTEYEEGDEDNENAGNKNNENNRTTLDLVAYTHYFNDQIYLKDSGLDIAYLTKIFSNLSNCKEIIFSSTCGAWGLASYEKEIGMRITRSFDWNPDSVDFVQRMIHITMLAVMISGLQLERLELPSKAAIPPRTLIWPKLGLGRTQFSLVSLLELRLYIRVNWENFWVENIIEFIGAFPKLETLDLSFDSSTEEQQSCAILKSLCLIHLRVLSMVDMRCTEDDLIGLLLRHKETLNEIHFVDIEIIKGGRWKAVLAAIRDQLSVDGLILMDCLQNKKLMGIPSSQVPGMRTVEFSGDWPAAMKECHFFNRVG